MTEYKGYRIIPANNIMGYQLQHIGRGSIHASLSGIFTSVKIAKSLIDYYTKERDGEEVEDGETDSSSGSKQVQRRTNYRRKPSNDS